MVFTIIPALGLAYCTFFNNTKTNDFIDLVIPIQETCKSESGCPLIPKGWENIQCIPNEPFTKDWPTGERHCAFFSSNSTSLGHYFYITDTYRFHVHQRYYSNSVLYAQGGKNDMLLVTRHIKGEAKLVYTEN